MLVRESVPAIEGQSFTAAQQQWLERIRQHMAQNLSIDPEHFDLVPTLSAPGGLGAARRVFGTQQLDELLQRLNEAVAA
jgi:type I restriction enzyme, R subunit